MSKIRSLLILTAIIAALIAGCTKYEDGPVISLKSKTKRLTGANWSLDKYLRNDNDETSSVLISNYTEQYKEDGSLVRSYNDTKGDAFSEIGNWAFDENKEVIDINDVSSIDWSNQNSTLSTSSITILRLKSKEFWYKFENGGDTHEIQLVKK